MKKLLITCVFLALAGCSTVEGLGRDISAGARTVRDVF